MRHTQSECPVLAPQQRTSIKRYVTFAFNAFVKKRRSADLHTVKVELGDGNVSSRHRRSAVTIMRTLLRLLNVHQLMEQTEIFLRHSEVVAV